MIYPTVICRLLDNHITLLEVYRCVVEHHVDLTGENHYDDIMRVNVVRNAWKIDHPDNALMRSFYDSSLWESRKLEGDDAVTV